MAVDTPSDGQLPAYQSSSGKFEWVDESSGGSPGGSNNEIQFNNSGAFGGDAGFIMDTKGGGGSTIIRVGNLLVGAAKISAATTNGFTYIQSDGSGQIFLQSSADGGGTFSDTVVNIAKNSASDTATLKFRDSLTQEATIKLDGSGNLDIDNEQNNQNIEMTVKGTGIVEVKQATSNTDSTLQIKGNGTGTPKVTLTNDTKAITLQCDENNKLKVIGSLHDFIFDCSSASGGITFPDGTTQTTAADTYDLAAAQSGSDAEIQLDASAGTDSAVKLAAGTNITLTESGGDTITIAAAGGSGIGGSISEDQVAVGSTTTDEIEGSAGFTAALGGSGSTSVLKFGLSDGTTNYTRLRLNGTNAYLEFRDASDNGKAALGFQSTQGLKFYAKAGGLGAAEAFRITPNDEWGLQGANYGTAGQVLTSGGSGAAVSWADAGGDNGFDVILPDPTLISSSIYGKIPGGTFLIGTGSGSTQGVSTETYFYPFIGNHTGNLASMSINVSSAGAGTTQDFGIYEVSNGYPSSLIGKATFDVSTTGLKTQTSLSATIAITKGKMYYLGWSRASGSNFASIQCIDDSVSSGPSFGLGIGSAFGLDSESNQVLYLSSSGALPASVTVTSLLAKNRDFPHIGLLW